LFYISAVLHYLYKNILHVKNYTFDIDQQLRVIVQSSSATLAYVNIVIARFAGKLTRV